MLSGSQTNSERNFLSLDMNTIIPKVRISFFSLFKCYTEMLKLISTFVSFQLFNCINVVIHLEEEVLLHLIFIVVMDLLLDLVKWEY